MEPPWGRTWPLCSDAARARGWAFLSGTELASWGPKACAHPAPTDTSCPAQARGCAGALSVVAPEGQERRRPPAEVGRLPLPGVASKSGN